MEHLPEEFQQRDMRKLREEYEREEKLWNDVVYSEKSTPEEYKQAEARWVKWLVDNRMGDQGVLDVD